MRGFLRLGLGWITGGCGSSLPERFALSVPPSPGEDVAERVVDPEEELPASSFRLSGLGGGVSGMEGSLSPSRLLKILGRLGELEASRTGWAGRDTNLAPPLGFPVMLVILAPGAIGCWLLVKFNV